MTETKTVERAREEVEEGKRPSTAAGEFVQEEMHVDPVAQTALDGVRVDCLETTEDDPELVLVPLDGEDDESDPDADEENKL
jgi:hypothetical protein